MGGKNATLQNRSGQRVRARPPGGRQRRRAGEDPHVVGGAGRQLGLDHSGEEGSGQAHGQVLHARVRALSGHAADDHGDRQQRDRGLQPRLFLARHRHRERRPRRHPRHRRRIPGRRARLLHAVLRAQGQRHRQGRGAQGQGHRHQCRRQRGRRRHARHAEKARPRGQARLHHAGGAAAGDAGDAAGEEGRPVPRAAVRLQSEADAEARSLFKQHESSAARR